MKRLGCARSLSGWSVLSGNAQELLLFLEVFVFFFQPIQRAARFPSLKIKHCKLGTGIVWRQRIV